MNLCISDTYVDNQRQAKEFREARKSRDFLQARRIDQLDRSVDLGGGCNSLRESLYVKNVFLEPNAEWKYSVWENAMTTEIEMLSDDDAELLRCFAELKMLRSEYKYARDSLGEVAQWNPSDYETLVAYYHKSDRLEDIFTELLPNYEPTVHPFTNTLLYSYDYGDGWCV